MPLDWDDLRLFSVVAKSGSMRGAAVELGVHASTVTRRLEHFERTLNVVLFHRGARGLSLTRPGEALLDRVSAVAGQIDDIAKLAGALDQQLSGVIAVSLPHALAGELLLGELAQFARLHPQIRLDFDGQADLTIAVTDEPPLHLIGRRVGHCAFARYRARAPGALDAPVLAENPAVRLAAACAGLGAAELACAVADPVADLERLPGVAPRQREIWLLTQPELRSTPRVRLLTTFLVEVFERHRVALRGERGGRALRGERGG